MGTITAAAPSDVTPSPRDLGLLVGRLNSLTEIFCVQGEILATGTAAVPALAAFLCGASLVFSQPHVAAAECLGALRGEAIG
jgi:hypothetical protein